jgi:hypothetical protein
MNRIVWSVAAVRAASVSGGCSHLTPPCQRKSQTFFADFSGVVFPKFSTWKSPRKPL